MSDLKALPQVRNLNALLAVSAAVVMWGLAPVANRFLVGGATGQVAPGPLLALRFGLAALVLLPLALRTRLHRWERRDQVICLVAALCGVVGYNLPVTLGLVTVPAGATALIVATEPVWILFLWALLKRQAPSKMAAFGAVIGLTGIAILESGNFGRLSMESLSGMSLVMLGAFFWSAYCVLTADLIRRKGALAVTSITVVIGSLPFLIVNGPQLPDVVRGLDTAGLLAVGLLAFGSSVVATILWNQGVGALPGSRSGAFLHGVPIIGVFAGHYFLGEALSLRVAMAAILVLSGVLVAQLHE